MTAHAKEGEDRGGTRCLALPAGARSLAWSHRRRTEDNREARPHRDSEHSSTIRFIDALGCGQLAAMDPADGGEEKQQRRQNDAHQDGSLPRRRPPGRRVNQPQRRTRRGLNKRGYEDPTPQGAMRGGGDRGRVGQGLRLTHQAGVSHGMGSEGGHRTACGEGAPPASPLEPQGPLFPPHVAPRGSAKSLGLVRATRCHANPIPSPSPSHT